MSQLARASELMMVATQPSFLYDIGDDPFHLPEALVRSATLPRHGGGWPDGGVQPGCSVISDANPPLGMRSAALRRTRAGRDRARTGARRRAGAVGLYSRSALVSGESARLPLAPGFQADMVVLSATAGAAARAPAGDQPSRPGWPARWPMRRSPLGLQFT